MCLLAVPAATREMVPLLKNSLSQAGPPLPGASAYTVISKGNDHSEVVIRMGQKPGSREVCGAWDIGL